MLKRIIAICVVIGLLLPALNVPASASSVLWVSTSDHTDLIKDEHAVEEGNGLLLMAAPGLDVATESVECEDGGLEILYEEPGPTEPISVEEAVSPDLIIVEDEAEYPPVELEEIELEEIINDEIQIP